MARLRLTSVVIAVMALSGAWATPVRAVESTRLVASIACFADDTSQRQELPASLLPPTSRYTIVTTPRAHARAARSTSLPHALYQRPPPA